MSKRDNQPTVYNQVCFHTVSVLKYVLITVFAFFYILAPYYVSSGFADNNTQTISRIPNAQSNSSSKSDLNFYHFPVTGANTANFIKEDSKDDETQLFWVYFSGDKFLESFLQLLYVSIQDSVQNRQQIPLFVLYHSWKSFLLS
jgi:hypothetical protein